VQTVADRVGDERADPVELRTAQGQPEPGQERVRPDAVPVDEALGERVDPAAGRMEGHGHQQREDDRRRRAASADEQPGGKCRHEQHRGQRRQQHGVQQRPRDDEIDVPEAVSQDRSRRAEHRQWLHHDAEREPAVGVGAVLRHQRRTDDLQDDGGGRREQQPAHLLTRHRIPATEALHESPERDEREEQGDVGDAGDAGPRARERTARLRRNDGPLVEVEHPVVRPDEPYDDGERRAYDERRDEEAAPARAGQPAVREPEDEQHPARDEHARERHRRERRLSGQRRDRVHRPVVEGARREAAEPESQTRELQQRAEPQCRSVPGDERAERADGDGEHGGAEAASPEAAGRQLQRECPRQHRDDADDGRDDVRAFAEPLHQVIVSSARVPVNADGPHRFGG
jgi:hypothetical protein